MINALPMGRWLPDQAAEARAKSLRRVYVRDDTYGHFRPSREDLLLHNWRESHWRQDLLAWLRDHVHREIPSWYYHLVLGHDIHVSTRATLHVRQYHAHELDPFTGRVGWWENIGLVSGHKVTVAFRDFEIDCLVADSTTYGDFKYHEVGTSTQAEANTDTTLVVTTGIAREAGTQVEAAVNQYQSVATVTADTGETWNEHGVFNASTNGVLIDRSVLSPAAVVVASDTVQFTWTLTKNAEA